MSSTGRAPSLAAAPQALKSNGDPTTASLGREGRKQVTDIQRARMIAAAVQAACERGAGNVTVARVVTRAGVSRRTFYEIFDDCEGCLLAAVEDELARVWKSIAPTYEMPAPWRERMRGTLTALLESFDEEPVTARFLVVETLAAGAAALQVRERVMSAIIDAVRQGEEQQAKGAPRTPLAADAIVGAVFSVLHSRMVQADPGPMVELVNPLMSTIVLPYLGPAAARRELARVVSSPVRRPARGPENPLSELDIRLTYRTVRALAAVAARPRSSNRAIASEAGISDQGQVSKLLTRLERLGLIERAGGDAGPGSPNAWMLTPSGVEVHQAVTPALLV
jgi:AcrR family transcriptional regulator